MAAPRESLVPGRLSDVKQLRGVIQLSQACKTFIVLKLSYKTNRSFPVEFDRWCDPGSKAYTLKHRITQRACYIHHTAIHNMQLQSHLYKLQLCNCTLQPLICMLQLLIVIYNCTRYGRKHSR
jgi:hypothetical protein